MVEVGECGEGGGIKYGVGGGGGMCRKLNGEIVYSFLKK